MFFIVRDYVFYDAKTVLCPDVLADDENVDGTSVDVFFRSTMSTAEDISVEAFVTIIHSASYTLE